MGGPGLAWGRLALAPAPPIAAARSTPAPPRPAPQSEGEQLDLKPYILWEDVLLLTSSWSDTHSQEIDIGALREHLGAAGALAVTVDQVGCAPPSRVQGRHRVVQERA